MPAMRPALPSRPALTPRPARALRADRAGLPLDGRSSSSTLSARAGRPGLPIGAGRSGLSLQPLDGRRRDRAGLVGDNRRRRQSATGDEAGGREAS